MACSVKPSAPSNSRKASNPASHIIEVIKEFEARYPGLEQMMIHWAEGIPPKEFQEQLRRFAKEVMPAFQG